MIDPKEIEALVKLLDDPDAEIFEHVEGRLLSLGNEVIPTLEREWEHSFNGLQQQRIENVIHKIQFGNIQEDLKIWALGGAFDLLQGVLIINKYQYPDLDEQKIINQLEAIKRDAWVQMSYDMSALERIRLLNHVFYSVYGFAGNTANHQDPQNSYINLVLESKKGNQILLAVIYSIVAQKLDIPVFGVNLPQHFILAYKDEQEARSLGPLFDNGIIFYINAFNKGFVFHRRDVDIFLKQLKLEPRKEFYEPCTHVDIVKRIIRNLISSYEKLGYADKVAELSLLIGVLE